MTSITTSLLFEPKKPRQDLGDPESNRLLAEMTAWFEQRGLPKLKEDWHAKTWNHDFVEFQRDKQLFAHLMTPSGYGAKGSCWNTHRNTAFYEVLGYYGLTYWYTLHVSQLGLTTFYNGDNEELKHRCARLLQEGAVFAFGLSEKTHGADVYSTEMQLIHQDDGSYLARGSKYYIGNGNEARMIAVFGKMADSGDYVFFTVDSKHERFKLLGNTVNEQNYVASFELDDYPVAAADVSRIGQEAWDDFLNTINLAKFNLGPAAIGLCTHALYEAIAHAHNRHLYGKRVTDFPHVRSLFLDAYARLAAMRLFTWRTVDYMRSASPKDRRYLLFSPMVKMKVTLEGERVVEDLHNVITAKGFEKEPFFEIAAHEIRMLPKLEGTAHINMGLVVKFLESFMFQPKDAPEVGRIDDDRDDTFMFHQGPTKGLGKVEFSDCRAVYAKFDQPNVEVFKAQIEAFRRWLAEATPTKEQRADIDFMLSVGELFSLVVYGQLILEAAELDELGSDLIDQMFETFVRDWNMHSTALYSKGTSTGRQRELAQAMLRAPAHDADRQERVFRGQILPLAER